MHPLEQRCAEIAASLKAATRKSEMAELAAQLQLLQSDLAQALAP